MANYYHSHHYFKECKNEWGTIQSYYDLCDNMTRFLRSKIDRPCYHHNMGSYEYETKEYVNTFCHLNNEGLLTTNAQPGGIFSGFSQREYVEINSPVECIVPILEELKEYSVYIVITIANKWRCHEFTEIYRDNINNTVSYCAATGFILSFPFEKNTNEFIGEKYMDVFENSSDKYLYSIPLTISQNSPIITYYDGLPCRNYFPLPIEFVTKSHNIFSNKLCQSAMENVATINVIDPVWNKSGRIFNIMKEIARVIEIPNINFT